MPKKKPKLSPEDHLAPIERELVAALRKRLHADANRAAKVAAGKKSWAARIKGKSARQRSDMMRRVRASLPNASGETRRGE